MKNKSQKCFNDSILTNGEVIYANKDKKELFGLTHNAIEKFSNLILKTSARNELIDVLKELGVKATVKVEEQEENKNEVLYFESLSNKESRPKKIASKVMVDIEPLLGDKTVKSFKFNIKSMIESSLKGKKKKNNKNSKTSSSKKTKTTKKTTRKVKTNG